MKVICTKADLSRGLATVGRAVTTKGTLPILANVKLSVEQGRLRLAATNLELGIQAWVNATIEESGYTTLPARILTDFVNFLPHQEITIATQEDTHESLVESSVSAARIRGIDPAEFPLMPQIDGDPALVLDAMTLKTMVDDIGLAASRDDDRPALTGIYLEVQEGSPGTLTGAAADAYRLAVENVPLVRESSPIDLLVPAKTLKDLASILPTQGQVAISITPNRGQVLFHTEGIDLASRLLEGPYVNFRAMLPDEYQVRAVLETSLLTSVLKTAALFASESERSVALSFRPQTQTMTAEASTIDLGTNTSTIPATYLDTSASEELEILLNVRYVTEALSALSGIPEVAFELRSRSRPAIIKPVGKKELLYLIMPMQLRNSPARPASSAAAAS